MNPTEAASVYAMAQQMDSRMRDKKLSTVGAKLWARVLKPVPFRDAEDIIVRLYSSHQMSVLQPGTIVEEWEELKHERRKIVGQVHSIDRYLRIEDNPAVIDEKLQKRAELLAELPQHVIDYAGIGQRQLNPPPKYPRRGVMRPPLELGYKLKSV